MASVSASSSSSYPSTSLSLMKPRNSKYDVFLSFRGEDTRDNFASHLFSALSQKSIETFIDDQLNRGDEISESLMNAIEASAISLIIFSEGYASSRWCLDELLKILDCRKEYAQIVIPVFYRVDPSDVRNQTGSFGDSFSKLEERFKENSVKLQTWRNALREAASLSGFHSLNIRPESKLVKEVVNHILKRLATVFPCVNNNQLVGVESRVEEIESLLGVEWEDVYTLGIWGIGGIGKTTIAKAIFEKISSDFEGSCFLQNVREESVRPGGLACLQLKLLSKLLQDDNVMPNIALSFRRLSRRKILIVFDDVSCFNQIESLIGSLDWFMPGSRIIITTRDKQVLRNWGVKKIYEMEALEYDHALELFSRHAFKQTHPVVGYEELSSKVMEYAQGVPLALKVLGCFLFGREKEVWKSAINKLKSILHPSIQEILKISYDGLDDKEKNIFLDVACFFKGEDVYSVMKFLDASGFYPEIGISVLVDKSLIVISNNDRITMHDLLQELGRDIVLQESVNPGNRSRFWHHEDIYGVLTYNMGTEKIEGICLDMSKVKEICLNPDTFTKMCRLRFLKFYSSINGENKCQVSDFRALRFAEVRYLHWHGYPFKSLPSNIHPEKLVILEMPHSNIEQLSESVQHHGKLNQIIMAACNIFTKTPNPSLIQHLNKLVILNLSGCSKLKSLPEISSAGNIEKILLDGTAIEELPSSIGCLSRLLELNLGDCKNLKTLPSSLCKLKSLEEICLTGSAIEELPSPIECLSALCVLDLGDCKSLKSLKLPFDGLYSLTYLYLTDCAITELPESLGLLSSLEELYLERNNFERIPESIIRLSKLSSLLVSYCERLQSLPKLPCNLYWLDAQHCTTLESLSGLFSSYKCVFFYLNENFKLDRKLRGIVEDALQNIQLMATARWKEIREKISYPALQGHVVLPGNEIPMWFSSQAFRDHHVRDWSFKFYCEFKIKLKDCDPHVIQRYLGRVNYVEPDHLLLGYYFFNHQDLNGCWEYNCVPEAVQFYFKKVLGSETETLDCCGVKKCGIHLFHASDSMDSMEDPSKVFNRKEVEEPHPKRLKYL
ncbi:disease resistance protein RPV1-like isoform X2 [Citrus sinensis]|uniref:disease resistance protein RPV1-like isoform X2 n=1 Tax=Citrus sinensis TaxID=2711 RepID=UPI0022799219|nr:disease resistance protein RPV1-like isoform X2 [Citrus sinensis]